MVHLEAEGIALLDNVTRKPFLSVSRVDKQAGNGVKVTDALGAEHFFLDSAEEYFFFDQMLKKHGY